MLSHLCLLEIYLCIPSKLLRRRQVWGERPEWEAGASASIAVRKVRHERCGGRYPSMQGGCPVLSPADGCTCMISGSFLDPVVAVALSTLSRLLSLGCIFSFCAPPLLNTARRRGEQEEVRILPVGFHIYIPSPLDVL